MIDHLLQKLESPRRHLTLLVGLLALVFVLTAIVAWRASEADQARVNMANSALEEAAALTLGDWSGLMQQYAASTLFSRTMFLARPSGSPEKMLASIDRELICAMCSTTDPVTAVFIVDPATGEIESAGEPASADVASAIRDRILSGQAAAFHDQVLGGLYFVDIGGQVTAAFAYAALDTSGTPMRITGFVLHPVASHEMIKLAMTNARKLPSAFAPELPTDRVFVTSATVGSVRLLGSAAAGDIRTRVVEPPVFGLTLALGVRSTAGSVFAFGESTAERTTIFLLMVVISALLITAMLQVRREAAMTRLRADFVSGVSHELRTPLAQIRMFTETLLLGRVRSDVERRRSLEIIDQEARRLSYLVENVLLFSKTEGGRAARVAPEPTHFADEIRRAVDSLSLLCRSRSAEVRMELQENITVPIDRMALRQILINLVDNALKYGPVGQRITVGAALFDMDARIWVDDEGPGIPAADRTRVFDSFYRLPREDQSRVTGSGIGLAVVRELARLHGGEAWAESAPGHGARIVVQFPDAYLRSEETGDFAAAS